MCPNQSKFSDSAAKNFRKLAPRTRWILCKPLAIPTVFLFSEILSWSAIGRFSNFGWTYLCHEVFFLSLKISIFSSFENLYERKASREKDRISNFVPEWLERAPDFVWVWFWRFRSKSDGQVFRICRKCRIYPEVWIDLYSYRKVWNKREFGSKVQP